MGQHSEVDDLTPEQRERLRRFRRRMLLLIPACLAGVVLGVVMSRHSLPAPRPGHRATPWWLLPAILIPTLLLLVALQYWVLRRRFFRPGAERDLIVSGSTKDIRRVVKQLRRREPVAEADRPIVAAFIRSWRRQQRKFPWLVGALASFLVIEVTLVVVSGHSPISWLAIVSLSFSVVVLTWSFVMQQRAVAGARAQGFEIEPGRPSQSPNGGGNP